jgi:tetratricopeptide (TPR) repeat protein
MPPLQGERGEGVQRLRAEVAATEDRARQARLLNEVGDMLERAGDEASAARDYLASFNADPMFREPLEALVRLMERRRSLKNLGRVIDALARASVSAEEKVRALTMRAAFLEDTGNDPDGAKEALREATSLEASDEDRMFAWLSLELLAAKTGDLDLRKSALAERARHGSDPTWQALLLIDLARMTAGDDVGEALSLLDEARSKGGEATFLAATAAEKLAKTLHQTNGEAHEMHADAYASALEAQATLIQQALGDAARGDAQGVPHGVRTAAHLADVSMRAAEVRRLSGDLPRAAQILDRAVNVLDDDEENHEGLLPFLFSARIRVAELMGDTELAAKFALRRLEKVKEGSIAASFAMRVAEQAASIGDAKGALEAVSKAVNADPECLPARALQLDLLADGGDPAAFASQLEAFADCLPSEAARARAFVLAAYVWGVQADDAPAAKAALAEARMLGTGENVLWRVARMVALLRGESGWADDVARRLLKGGTDAREDSQASGTPMEGAPDDAELSYLWLGVIRNKIAAGDEAGLSATLKELADAPDGAWLAHSLEAFLPAPPSDGRASEVIEEARGRALEKLADLEQDPKLARGLSLLAAVRTHEAGDSAGARERLRVLAAKNPSDPVIATYLAELERKDGAFSRAALTLTACAMATDDRALAAALHLEAGFSRWRAGERAAALDAFQHAADDATNTRVALTWAARGTDAHTLEGRRRAIQLAERSEKDGAVVALERFATETMAGDEERATLALGQLEEDAEGDLALAAALARLVWPPGDSDATRVEAAISRIAPAGPVANQLAAAEQLRRSRQADPSAAVEAAQRWFDAGGALPAAFEWLIAAMAVNAPARESDARRAIAGSMNGSAREAMLASAAMLDVVTGHADKTPLLSGDSPATRLANLEISPPGCDPRRRAHALRALGGALGDDATSDAESLAGWSLLLSGDAQSARRSFSAALAARPGDLAAWEGLRAAATQEGDRKAIARATMELGVRCSNDTRGAAFLEEAGQLLLELGEEKLAEVAFEKAFGRDGARVFSFDKVFRAARARKDSQKLLALVGRRLDISEDPAELAKLFWEQARVLRESGDVDGALKALENVTMFEPEHVGALALTGEIFIRRGMYDEAAENLSKLATIDDAPAKNRVTAGIAAVDLYENKLDRYDRALEVLVGLHRAGLSTLPVRERLARAAARTGSWREATNILEVLMHERPEPAGRIEAARLAMAIHRDRLGTPQLAVPAIVKLLEEQPTDGEAIDVALGIDFDAQTKQKLLQYVGEALCDSVRVNPIDGPALRRLGRIAHAVGDTEVEHVALSAAQVVAGPEPAEEAIVAGLVLRKPRVPQMAMPPALRAMVAAPGDEGATAALFRVLAPTLAEALGPSLAALGVGKRDKVDPRSGLALRNEIASWAGAFGVDAFDLYVGGKDPMGVYGIPGEMPALVVGPAIASPLPPALRGKIASEFYALARGSTIVRSRDATSVAAIVVAACHLGEVRIEAPAFAVLAEFERSIGKAIARRTKKLLPELCHAVVASREDARAWHTRAQLSLARCAVLASGDVPAVLCDLMGEPLDRVRGNVARDERAVDLLKFALSASYLEVRRALGLEGLT